MTEKLIGTESEMSGLEPGTRVINLEKGRRAFLQTLGLGIAGAAILGNATSPSSSTSRPSSTLPPSTEPA